jgi:hypothetical protein
MTLRGPLVSPALCGSGAGRLARFAPLFWAEPWYNCFMATADPLRFRCACGVSYKIIPKEIPLAEDEVIHCECGRALKARHSTRYFDYEKIE